MSKELNLHYSSLNFMAARQNKIENLRDVLSKSGKSECKSYSALEMRKMIQDYHTKGENPHNLSMTVKNAQISVRLDKSPSESGLPISTSHFHSQ